MLGSMSGEKRRSVSSENSPNRDESIDGRETASSKRSDRTSLDAISHERPGRIVEAFGSSLLTPCNRIQEVVTHFINVY